MAGTEQDGGAGGAAPVRRGRGRVLVLAVAALLGGGAFHAVYSGLVPVPFDGGVSEAGGTEAGGTEAGGTEAGGSEAGGARPDEGPGMVALEPARRDAAVPAFVALEPMIVSLAPDAASRHLKFSAVIEVDPERLAEVEAVRPRIVDVLGGYLRAVDAPVIERPAAMPRLRAQLLRRVQLVSPPGAVRDVLIQEFVLN